MRRLLGLVLATAAALGAAAAPAGAAVTIGPDRVVVDDPDGARAVIDRRPLRIAFEDAAGNAVLRQWRNDRLPAAPWAPTVQPEPTGALPVPKFGFYAPFTFEVGGSASAQWPHALWAGNMLLGAKGGVQGSAHDVTAAVADGDGVRLTVSTSDPTRTMTVRVHPDAGPALRVRAALSHPHGVTSFTDSFESAGGEAFRGFGGRHNALDQRGNDFYAWTEQENVGWGDTQQFPNGPTAAYYVQNQFVSSRGYGFLLDQTELSRWRMASDKQDAWQVTADATSLDYTVAVGDAPKAIRTLTSITGRHRVPPAWSQGPTLYRGVKLGTDNRQTYEQKIEDDLVQLEQRGIDLDAYAYEGWNWLDRAKARSINDRLRARGIHPMGYLRAFVADDGAGFDSQALRDEAVNKGYVAKTADGRPYQYWSSTPAYVIDFTNPAAVAWWERRVREMLDLGFDGFMQDFGEQVQADMHFHNGETGRTMHNRYGVIYHRVTRDIVDRYMAEHPGREIYFFTRTGFSGRPGSAASENANFPGDETIDWSRSTGIGSLTTDMLNRGIGGLYGFTTDIGGYIGSDPVTKELFVRWSQWAALSPFFRVHNGGTAGVQMPWSFDAEALAAWKAMAALHRRATPYLRTLWQQAADTGMPVTRPLWLAAPGDAEAARQDQSWMLGDDVLVAPVVKQGAASRDVWFPPGCWRDPESGTEYAGGRSHAVAAPLTKLPYFFRCGTAPF
jgi:alpha-D-xyloside xylohydrolase